MSATPRVPQEAEQRFWPRVARTDTCWFWLGAVCGCGYGALKRGCREDGQIYAHRFSYELAYGEVPVGAVVMHICDVPRCVNPDHLAAGTQAENIRDRDNKGRHWAPRGADAPHARLSAAEVRAIRTSDATQAALARLFGVAPSTIQAIVSRRTWRHEGDAR